MICENKHTEVKIVFFCINYLKGTKIAVKKFVKNNTAKIRFYD